MPRIGRGFSVCTHKECNMQYVEVATKTVRRNTLVKRNITIADLRRGDRFRFLGSQDKPGEARIAIGDGEYAPVWQNGQDVCDLRMWVSTETIEMLVGREWQGYTTEEATVGAQVPMTLRPVPHGDNFRCGTEPPPSPLHHPPGP